MREVCFGDNAKGGRLAGWWRRAEHMVGTLGLLVLAATTAASVAAQAPGTASVDGVVQLQGATLEPGWFVTAYEQGTGRALESTQADGAGVFSLSVPIGPTGTTEVELLASGRVTFPGSPSHHLLRLPRQAVRLRHGEVAAVQMQASLARITGEVPAGDVGQSPVTSVRATSYASDLEPVAPQENIATAGAAPGAPWEIAALAGVPVRIRREVAVTSLGGVHLPEIVAVLAPGETLDLGVEPLPWAGETLDWSLSLSGPRRFTRATLSSMPHVSASRFSSSSTLDAAGSAAGSVTGLLPQRYWPMLRLSGTGGFVTLPRTLAPPFVPGAPYDVQAAQATLSGALALTGTASQDDLVRFTLRLQEPGERVSDHHSLLGASNPQVADYSGPLVEGDWQWSSLFLTLGRPASDPQGYLKETVTHLKVAPPVVTLAPGGNSAAPDLELRWGRVILDLRDAAGIPVPLGGVRAFCTRRDVSGALLEWSDVTSTPEQKGIVEMVLELPEGECELSVYDPGRRTFLDGLWVRLQEGDIVRMDLHPPVLHVAEPLDGSCSDGSLRVRGTVSDPYGVAAVEIGGVSAALSPVAVPSAPNEVAFDEVVPVGQPGLQTLEVRATDLGGASTLRLLAIRGDFDAPTFQLPPSPATTVQTTYRLVGDVLDDDELEEVRVGGHVLARDIGGPSYALDVDLPLSPGDNTFVLEAEDACGKLTTETFVVRQATEAVGRSTGGGHFTWPGAPSSDIPADSGSPGAESRTTFGFVAGTDGQGRLTGNLLLVRHLEGGTHHRLQSHDLLSAVASGNGEPADEVLLRYAATHTLPGKPRRTESVVVELWTRDGGEPGADTDLIRVEVQTTAGQPVPGLLWPQAAPDGAVPVQGGNVQVR